MKNFTADTHLGAKHIHEFAVRPFSTRQKHDLHVISKINEYVKRDDELFVVGDFCNVDPLPYLKDIECDFVTLAVGNHDLEKYFHRFYRVIVADWVRLNAEYSVWVAHYPHVYWPASHRKSLHVYGHLHGVREACMNQMMPQRRSGDVGVDAARRMLGEYRPFNENEIINWLGRKEGHDQLAYYDSVDLVRKAISVDNDGNLGKYTKALTHRPPMIEEVETWVSGLVSQHCGHS